MNTERGAAVDALVGDEPTFAPDFILVEVVHVIRREERQGKIRPERASEAIEDLRIVSLETVKVVGLLGRLWKLRHNLSAYDARMSLSPSGSRHLS